MGGGSLESPPSAAELVRIAVVAAAGLVVSGSTIVVAFMTYNERREGAGSTA